MKYKPKPYYKAGFVAPAAGDAESLVGRMLPQPLVERPDRSTAMLDDVRGRGFMLLAYGGDAQAVMAEADRCAWPLPVSDRIAICPRTFNPDRDHVVTAMRDVNGTLGDFLGMDGSTLLLVRPDHYVAAAVRVKPGAIDALASAARDLAGSAA
jgi:3-(3-hydroxy-phenyl)propionate hydroxylase